MKGLLVMLAPGRLSLNMGRVAAFLLIVMMAFITTEVILRLFGATTRVATEWSGYLLVGVAFFGLAEALRSRAHVKIKLVTACLPIKVQLVLEVLAYIIAFIGISILFWATFMLAFHSYSRGALTVSVIQVPLFIPQLLMPIGLLFFAIQMMAGLLEQVKSLKTWSIEK